MDAPWETDVTLPNISCKRCTLQVVQFMAAHGVKRIVECGPGKVLTGLSKRIADSVECIAIQDSASLNAAIENT